MIALGNNESFHASDAGEAIVTMAVKGERVAPPAAVKTTPLDPALVARLVGEYTLTDSARSALTGKLSAAALASIAGLTLSREGDRLFAKPSGQSAFELFRDDAGGLFAKVAGIRVAVTADGVAILQAGLTIPYARVKTPPPPVKPKTKAITK